MPDFGHIENAYRMLAADEAVTIVGDSWRAERSGARVTIVVEVIARASAAALLEAPDEE